MTLIDISHILNSSTPVFPADFRTTLEKHMSLERDHYCSHLLTSCLHTGTHIDIPAHLIKDERTVADFSLDSFAGKGILLDVRGEQSISYIPRYETLITERSVVLLFTGYDEFFQEEKYFTSYPTITDSLAELLIRKQVKMLGIDTPSPDRHPYDLHKKLLRNDILLLENLTNLKSLVGAGNFEVLAFPLKIDAEASFVRAVCLIR